MLHEAQNSMQTKTTAECRTMATVDTGTTTKKIVYLENYIYVNEREDGSGSTLFVEFDYYYNCVHERTRKFSIFN